MRHLNENLLNLNSEQLHASEIRQIAAIYKFQVNFEAQKEDSNIFVWYTDDEVFYESFHSQKWRDREILFGITRNSLKTIFVKTRVRWISYPEY